MCFFGLSMVGLTVYGLFLDFQLLGVLVFDHLLIPPGSAFDSMNVGFG